MTISRIQHAIHITELGDISLAKKLDYAQTLETAIAAQFPEAKVSVYLTRNMDLINTGCATRINAENENTPIETLIKSVQGIASQMADTQRPTSRTPKSPGFSSSFMQPKFASINDHLK